MYAVQTFSNVHFIINLSKLYEIMYANIVF